MAGITHLKEFNKPALRGLVDAMEQERLNVQDGITRFMPEDNVYSTEFAYDVIKQSNQIAGMIGFGAEPPVRDRDEVARRMGELAKFGLKDIVTEEELLRLHNPRNNAEESALVDKLIVKGADMVKSIQDRIDITKSQALSTGRVEYDDNGVKVSIDFTQDMPDEHKIVLSGSTWADEGHDVIGDLLEWTQDYEANAGKTPDAILMSREVQALLLKNSVIVAEASGVANSGRGRVSVEELNSVLGGYSLPPVIVVSKTKAVVKDIYTGKNETIEYFPTNRIVMVSEGAGTFLSGPTVENDFEPGIVLDAYDQQEPIKSILRVAAAGFPVIENPNLLFHADVFTEGGVEG